MHTHATGRHFRGGVSRRVAVLCKSKFVTQQLVHASAECMHDARGRMKGLSRVGFPSIRVTIAVADASCGFKQPLDILGKPNHHQLRKMPSSSVTDSNTCNLHGGCELGSAMTIENSCRSDP